MKANIEREKILSRYHEVRKASLAMCEPLEPEDFQIQPCEEVSPPKWNLGHTSWFFWQFVLGPKGQTLPEDEEFRYFLNSYYQKAGSRIERGRRGFVARPTLKEVYRYRSSVDDRMEQLIRTIGEGELPRLQFLVTVGTHHEQQHQELFYTEIKNIYSATPVQSRPAYLASSKPKREGEDDIEPKFLSFQGGLHEFGNVEGGWCWDNELSTHLHHLRDFSLRDRLVTNREYLEFMEDGGYSNPLLWLSDGWAEAEKQQWKAPLYWERIDEKWWMFTLSGMREVNLDEPVCHVSFYEAQAFAQWKSHLDAAHEGVRLPTEREWEHAARISRLDPADGCFVEDGILHPKPPKAGLDGDYLRQMLGDVWEWTSSHYEPYPGFREFPDNLSEYNGKFMNNQRVLRGGSCVTPRNHIRISYRNFWHPEARFQFTGIRLAKSLDK